MIKRYKSTQPWNPDYYGNWVVIVEETNSHYKYRWLSRCSMIHYISCDYKDWFE